MPYQEYFWCNFGMSKLRQLFQDETIIVSGTQTITNISIKTSLDGLVQKFNMKCFKLTVR